MVFIDRLYRDLVRRPALAPRLRQALFVVAVLVRKIDRDAVFVRAGTLSYWSLVALVPGLILMALVLRALGLESWFSFSTFAGRALTAVLPEWDAVGLPQQVDAKTIGVAGLVVAFAAPLARKLTGTWRRRQQLATGTGRITLGAYVAIN